MRNKLILILLIALYNVCFGQTIDSSAVYKADVKTKIKQDSIRTDKRYRADSTFVRDSLTAHKDTLAVRDTSAIKDSAKILTQIFTPKDQFPVEPFRGLNYIINKEQILFNDYRSSGEILERFPLTFIRSLATLGQPHEVTIDGAGFNETSYLSNGLLMNSRLTNSFDLNDLQSESVDSIEVIPSPRGFLYGTFNNEASVNFISKESFALKERGAPYSRLRYYQAQNEEAMVDFLYNSHWFRRISTTFELTNKTYNDPKNPLPQNSDYSLWNAALKLKYFLSKNFNLIGSYNYIKSSIGLYGGVVKSYIDTTKTIDLTEAGVYFPVDLTEAGVNIPGRYKKNTSNNVVLQLLGTAFQYDKTDLKAYYLSNLMEFRQNEFNTSPDSIRIFDNNRSKVYGISLSEAFNAAHFYLDLYSTYEINNFKADLLSINKNINTFSFGGSAGLKLLDSSFIPSVFGKYLSYDGKSYPGFGADLVYKYSTLVHLYAGLSHFKQPFNPVENQFVFYGQLNNNLPEDNYRSISSFEAGVKVDYKGLKNSLSVFYRDVTNDPLAITTGSEAKRDFIVNEILYRRAKYWGIGTSLNMKLWRIYLESYGAYYYNNRKDIINYRLPEYTLRGGIYYRDTLFESNLHLKAGMYVQYTGAQSSYSYDFEKEMRSVNIADINQLNNIPNVSPSFQLDFRLVGQIQQRAILYFSVENILDKKYYIVPYYINPGRNIKIGFSWEFLN